MNQETSRFDEFLELTRRDVGIAEALRPTRLSNPIGEIIKIAKAHRTGDPDNLTRTLARTQLTSLLDALDSVQNQEIFDIPKAIESLRRGEIKDLTKIVRILQEIGHVHCLDISGEIQFLREAKDILDELTIMLMMFEDQRKVLKIMESSILLMTKGKHKQFPPTKHLTRKDVLLEPLSTAVAETVADQLETKDLNTQDSKETAGTTTPGNQMVSQKISPSAEAARTENLGVSEESREAVSRRAGTDWIGLTTIPDALSRSDANSKTTLPTGKDSERTLEKEASDESDLVDEPIKAKVEKTSLTSDIWRTIADPNSISLPLIAVQSSINDVDKMVQRVGNVYQSVSCAGSSCATE